MRLTFLATSSLDYPLSRGRLLPLARELVVLGHEVHLIMLHHAYERLPPSERQQRYDGVTVSYVGQMHVYGEVGQRRHFSSFGLLRVSLAGALALAQAAVQSGADALHICKPQPINGLAGLVAAQLRNCPIYVDCDDYEAGGNQFSARWQQWVVQAWEDNLPRCAAGITTNTHFLQQRYLDLGISPERIVYVPNGVSSARLVPPPQRHVAALCHALGLEGHPVVAYVGTINQTTHNVGLLLNAFARVAYHMPEARLLLVGSGEDVPVLRQRVHDLGLHNQVIWTGAVDYRAIPAFLALATCSVDPVADDGVARARSPLKIVESLAAGVPVVTGDVGDRAEMLAYGAAGVLVAPGSALALAEGILSLLRTTTRQQITRSVREQARCYLWSALARQWDTIYNTQ